MKIVIDANRVIAALCKQGTTREILFQNNFQFISPDFLLSEILEHQEELIAKLHGTKEEFELLLSLLLNFIIIIPESEYSFCFEKVQNLVSDVEDVPYLALCIAQNAYGIWTHDVNLQKQKSVKIITNIDMLKFMKNSEM